MPYKGNDERIVAPAGGDVSYSKLSNKNCIHQVSGNNHSARPHMHSLVTTSTSQKKSRTYLQVVRSVASCRYTRDPTSHLVESLMVSMWRMEPRRTHKDTVVTSVVCNVEDGTRIIGGQLGIRDGSSPCTRHGEPVGTQEIVDGEMLGPSNAM